MSPYREMALVVADKPRRSRRPRRLGLASGIVVAASGLVGALGVAPTAVMIAGCVGVYGLIVVSVMSGRRRAAAARRLAALPFPVVHSRENAVAADLTSSPIAAVTVRLVGERAALTEAAARLAAVEPALLATVHDGALVISRWCWGGDDLLLLAEVCERWGRAVHEVQPIREVFVQWVSNGPPAEM